MKLTRVFVAGALVALSLPMFAAVAKADGLPPGDPIVRTAGDPPLPGEVPEGIFTNNFTLSCPSGTCPGTDVSSTPNPNWCGLSQLDFSESSPSCFFENDISTNGIPQVINELVFSLPGVPFGSVSEDICTIPDQPVLFGTCTKVDDLAGGTIVTFTGGTIGFHQDFFLDFEGFDGGLVSPAYANVAEPGTLPMLGLGLIALLGLTRKRIFQQTQ
jgi:hypothetical protein